MSLERGEKLHPSAQTVPLSPGLHPQEVGNEPSAGPQALPSGETLGLGCKLKCPGDRLVMPHVGNIWPPNSLGS